MSQNLRFDSVEKFMTRVRTATQSRSKEVRMPIEDANELAAVIGQVLARLANNQSAGTNVVGGNLDGGSFT